jgi:hypothetical protein
MAQKNSNRRYTTKLDKKEVEVVRALRQARRAGAETIRIGVEPIRVIRVNEVGSDGK